MTTTSCPVRVPRAAAIGPTADPATDSRHRDRDGSYRHRTVRCQPPRSRTKPTANRRPWTVLAVVLGLATWSCKRSGPTPPDCDTTACCELFQQQVLEACTRSQDKVYGCGKRAKHAYEACIDHMP